MNVAIEKLPECRAKISAEVPSDEVKKTRSGVVHAFMHQAKVPGYRPGKLPEKVVEKRFKLEIDEELKERLGKEVLSDAYKNHDLAIIGVFKVERQVFESDGTFSYVSEVVVEPDVDLSEEDYKNIPVNVVKTEITQEMVDQFFENVQRNFGEFEESDDPAEGGDQALITYEATRDGKPLTEFLDEDKYVLAERADEFELVIPEEGGGPPQEIIPGLSKKLEGIKKDETREVEIEYDKEYFLEEMRETTALYKVICHGVKKRKLPPIDEALAERAGHKSLADLEARYREDIEMRIEQDATQQIDQQVLEHLNKDHEFELPPQMVFNEAQHQINQMVSNAVQQGMDPSEIDQHEDEIVDSANVRAVNNLRTRYLLDTIADQEKITVSDDELSQQVVSEARQAQKPLKKFVRELRDGPGFQAIRDNIRVGKTIAFLRENASVTEVEPEAEKEVSEDGSDES